MSRNITSKIILIWKQKISALHKVLFLLGYVSTQRQKAALRDNHLHRARHRRDEFSMKKSKSSPSDLSRTDEDDEEREDGFQTLSVQVSNSCHEYICNRLNNQQHYYVVCI